MGSYTITRVSDKPPRVWSFDDKKTGAKVNMESYRVMLEGQDEAVELNRQPGKKPTVGEVLNGEVLPSEYGPRFKAAPRPFTPGAGKDSAEIKAEWAIGQAVAYHTKDDISLAGIEQTATSLFHMVEQVKNSAASPQPVGRLTEKFQAWRNANAGEVDPNPKVKPAEDEVFDIDEDKPINLDDIPF